MSVGAAESETESPIRVTSGPSSDGGRAAVSCSLENVGRATAGSPSPSPGGAADDPHIHHVIDDLSDWIIDVADCV